MTKYIVLFPAVSAQTHFHDPGHPDPYSVQTARERHDRVGGAETMSDPIYGYGTRYKYREIVIKPSPEDKYRNTGLVYAKNDIRLNAVWKDFVHMPEVPRVENGWLLDSLRVVSPKIHPDAQYYEKEDVYIWQDRRRVLSSLNKRPENWEVYECVYRQLEPQWFLRMCNGR